MQTTTIRVGPDRSYRYTIDRDQVEDVIDILVERLRFRFPPGAITNCTRSGLDVVVTFDENILDLSYIKNVCEITKKFLEEVIFEEFPCSGCSQIHYCQCYS